MSQEQENVSPVVLRFDNSSSDEDKEDDSENLRGCLKIIRDRTKTAFDLLPTGESLGSFANRHAVNRYSRKVVNKRERARETRREKNSRHPKKKARR